MVKEVQGNTISPALAWVRRELRNDFIVYLRFTLCDLYLLYAQPLILLCMALHLLGASDTTCLNMITAS